MSQRGHGCLIKDPAAVAFAGGAVAAKVEACPQGALPVGQPHIKADPADELQRLLRAARQAPGAAGQSGGLLGKQECAVCPAAGAAWMARAMTASIQRPYTAQEMCRCTATAWIHPARQTAAAPTLASAPHPGGAVEQVGIRQPALLLHQLPPPAPGAAQAGQL